MQRSFSTRVENEPDRQDAPLIVDHELVIIERVRHAQRVDVLVLFILHPFIRPYVHRRRMKDSRMKKATFGTKNRSTVDQIDSSRRALTYSTGNRLTVDFCAGGGFLSFLTFHYSCRLIQNKTNKRDSRHNETKEERNPMPRNLIRQLIDVGG